MKSKMDHSIEETNEQVERRVKATVGKYVYHLTRKYNREKILKEGLKNYKKPSTGYVFAHNTNRFETYWYWFCLDSYELDFSQFYGNELEYMLDDKSQLRCCVNHFYDIWRIDTDIAGKEWYVDYVGLHDMPNPQEDYYVKHKGVINPGALTLCCLDRDFEKLVNETKTGFELTYINPIIPREKYIGKHRFTPEDEFKIVVNDTRLFVMHSEDKMDDYYWKKLKRIHFSLQDEIALNRVA